LFINKIKKKKKKIKKKKKKKKKKNEGKEQDNMGLLVGFPIEKIKSCLSLEIFGVPPEYEKEMNTLM